MVAGGPPSPEAAWIGLAACSQKIPMVTAQPSPRSAIPMLGVGARQLVVQVC